MVKNDICLGGASKQNDPFLKNISPKNAPMPLMSRIGPMIRAFLAYLRLTSLIIVFLDLLLPDKPTCGKPRHHVV